MVLPAVSIYCSGGLYKETGWVLHLISSVCVGIDRCSGETETALANRVGYYINPFHALTSVSMVWVVVVLDCWDRSVRWRGCWEWMRWRWDGLRGGRPAGGVPLIHKSDGDSGASVERWDWMIEKQVEDGRACE
jgi:hypothetical protein